MYGVIGIGHENAKEECEKIFRFQIKEYKLGLVWKSEEKFNIIAYNECKYNFPLLDSVPSVAVLAGWLVDGWAGLHWNWYCALGDST